MSARSALIRLAAILPPGNPDRQVILAKLAKDREVSYKYYTILNRVSGRGVNVGDKIDAVCEAVDSNLYEALSGENLMFIRSILEQIEGNLNKASESDKNKIRKCMEQVKKGIARSVLGYEAERMLHALEGKILSIYPIPNKD